MKRTGYESEKIKIAFDVHGVIDTYPEVIYPMIRMLTKIGNDVCIVSGPSKFLIKEDLKILNFSKEVFGFNRHIEIHSVVDFLKNNGVKTWKDDKGDVWTDDQNWWDSKAKICQRWGIKYMIDDSEKYRSAFDLTNCNFIHISELL